MEIQLSAHTGSPTFILVHGGWHGAWCWSKLLPILQESGMEAVAIDLPGHGEDKTPIETVNFNDYVGRIVEAAINLPGPVILLGHSSGGTPVAQAAEILTSDKVSSIVFLDAFMPQNGETVFSIVDKFTNKSGVGDAPGLAASLVISTDQKSSKLDLTKVKELIYHDCSDADVLYAKAHLGPQPMATLLTPVNLTDKNYGSIPKYYILCTEAKDFDKSNVALNVACKKIYRLKSSHSPFLSMPDKLAEILEDVYKQSSVSVLH